MGLSASNVIVGFPGCDVFFACHEVVVDTRKCDEFQSSAYGYWYRYHFFVTIIATSEKTHCSEDRSYPVGRPQLHHQASVQFIQDDYQAPTRLST
jgi:hypothetical protein